MTEAIGMQRVDATVICRVTQPVQYKGTAPSHNKIIGWYSCSRTFVLQSTDRQRHLFIGKHLS